jgi:hypothetical protein
VVDGCLILLVVREGLLELNLKSGVLNLQLQSDLVFGCVLGFPLLAFYVLKVVFAFPFFGFGLPLLRLVIALGQ